MLLGLMLMRDVILVAAGEAEHDRLIKLLGPSMQPVLVAEQAAFAASKSLPCACPSGAAAQRYNPVTQEELHETHQDGDEGCDVCGGTDSTADHSHPEEWDNQPKEEKIQ